LIDQFGRAVGSLRISITDRCDLRCVYCMPESGTKWLPKMSMLRVEEYVRLVRIAVTLGIGKVRITGGEPLLHPRLHDLIRALRSIPGIEDLAMTTNGVALAEHAATLRAAGLDRVNVSLDTIERGGFTAITRRDRLPDVFRGLDAAARAGLSPVKINTVVIRDYNEGAILDLAKLARTRPYQVRFIEYMPLDAQRRWELQKVVPAAEIRTRIGAHWPLEQVERVDARAPAQLYRFLDGAGTFGIIASVTEPFCNSCDRIRISADGKIRSCLFALEDTDLRRPLRSGASDAEIAALLRDAVWRKWEGHAIQTQRFVQPEGGMSYFGG
jgi:cyclic pyranopterin phosphate synthase